MQKLIQLVGVPGVGKTHLLRKCTTEGFRGTSLIDFGQDYSAWYKSQASNEPTPQSLRKYIDSKIFPAAPALVTTHIVHWRNGQFVFDSDLELYMDSSAYVVLLDNPQEIFARRMNDTRKRESQTLEGIREHQIYSLEITAQVARQIGSDLFVVNNDDPSIVTRLEAIVRRLQHES